MIIYLKYNKQNIGIINSHFEDIVIYFSCKSISKSSLIKKKHFNFLIISLSKSFTLF